MPTLAQIQARLRVELGRAVEARMQSTRTGPGQDGDWATLAHEIEARLMQPASPAEEDETPSTSRTCPTFTGPLQDEESMPTLTDEIKTFIVKGLACYDTPSQVAEAVKATFGIEVSRQQVYVYDPGCSQPPAPRWRELHAATRAALLRETAEVGVAHRAVRLRMLDRLAHRCERNSVALTLECLELAAKECGGMYENRRPIVLQQVMLEPSRPAAPQLPGPLPAAAPPAIKQHAVSEIQPTPPARPTPPLPEPLPVMPQPDMPALSAPQPLAVLPQAPQPPALPEARPLTREERYLAYVRDRHARDRAAAAQAASDSGRVSPTISIVPPTSS